MKDVFIILSLVIFAICAFSFVASLSGKLRTKKKCKCKKGANRSILGLISGEVFIGILFFVIAVIYSL